ncbi:hypothetical protein [Prosthecodimorpha hirschii]|uniref:hypothetical protein n=1 Tax=Prosthecodimorpha hirschii TaxID=665126 RepID=UPI00112C9A33|nr:hypothetical protein [Prosthecomicrobium hirschii]
MIRAERQAPAGALKNLRTVKAQFGHENPCCGILGRAGFSDRSIEILESICDFKVFTFNIGSGKMCLAKLQRGINIGKYCRVFLFEKYLEFCAWFVGFRRSTDETAWLLPGAAHDGGGG